MINSNNKPLEKIKLFLMDMDGTVYLGNNKIEGAFEALETLRSMGKRICFLTNNSSRSLSTYIKKLEAVYDFNTNADEVYTSALATQEFLKNKHPNAKVFLLATPDVQNEFINAGINVVEDDPDIVIVCFDTTLKYDRLYKACQYINNGKLYVATHPDNFCPAPDGPMPDVGAFIAMIEKTVGKLPDVIIGKPYNEMAEAVQHKFGLDKQEIAMVGDRLYTDIRFGVDNGFTSILVLTGETTREMLETSSIKPTVTLNTFADVLDLV